MKIDFQDPMIFLIGMPLIILCIAVVVMYQFIYIPEQNEIEQYKEKYPTHCLVEKNQTIIVISANAKMTLYHPEKICQVLVGTFPNEDNSTGYFVNYQYETQSKYNKTHNDYDLNCKPKTFDEETGNLICFNGTVAKEKWIYES